MSGDFRLRIPLWGSFVFVWCVVFNQGCCVFIQYNLLKGCCEWILIQPWTQVIDYSLPGLTWHIRLRISISHLSISGIVVHGRCYISHCFYFFVIFYFSIIFLRFFVGWSLFFVFIFMSLDSSLSNQESILTCLLSFWLINKLYHHYYGSFISYQSILYSIIVDYFILLCRDCLFTIGFIILFLFSLLFSF